MSAILPPTDRVWWKEPLERTEIFWIVIAFVWCLILFASMPFWHLKGGQNPSGIRSKVDPMKFYERSERFIADISQVTGVKVRERIPDRVVAEADQIVNVDITTEDLRRRLEDLPRRGPCPGDPSSERLSSAGAVGLRRPVLLRAHVDALETVLPVADA